MSIVVFSQDVDLLSVPDETGTRQQTGCTPVKLVPMRSYGACVVLLGCHHTYLDGGSCEAPMRLPKFFAACDKLFSDINSKK